MTAGGGAHPRDFRFVRVLDPSIKYVAHVGLWLERCYHCESGETEKDAKSKKERQELYRAAIEALRIDRPAVRTWKAVYERIQRERAQTTGTRLSMEIVATQRVLLHPSSNASVTDGSVLLHHTYGVPYLPGSGLKGLARAWMRRIMGPAPSERGAKRTDQRDAELLRALFGELPDRELGRPGNAAVVELMDALWIPELPQGAQSDWSPLALDVVNPHVSSYYTGEAAPTDHEEPVPTHRLTVAPGTRFLVELTSPVGEEQSMQWVRYVAERLIRPALQNLGFGAWTAAGYGRFGLPAGTEPDPVKWYDATVRLDPGSGNLTATMATGQVTKASAYGSEAQTLRNTLPEHLQHKLKTKRSLALKIQVEPHGNAWKIVAMRGG